MEHNEGTVRCILAALQMFPAFFFWRTQEQKYVLMVSN